MLGGATQARAPHAFGGLDPEPEAIETVIIDLDRHVFAFQEAVLEALHPERGGGGAITM